MAFPMLLESRDEGPESVHPRRRRTYRRRLAFQPTPPFADVALKAGFCGKSDPGQALDASMGGPTIRLRNVYLR